MKRLKILLCAALLLLITVMLIGCGGNSTGNTGSNITSTLGQNAAPSQDDIEKVDIAAEQDNQFTMEVGSGNTDTSTRPAGDNDQEYGGMVRVNVTGDIDFNYGLPWLQMQVGGSPYVLVPVSEALLTQEMKGVLTPGLAKECTPDIENKEILFTLRDNVYFSDGSKFNAEAVVWNFERWRESGIVQTSVTGVEARGEYEVAVLMGDGFNNAVPHYYTARSTGMVSKENYEKVGAEVAALHPATTAPFQLKERIPGVKAVFEKNPTYWQDGKPYLDVIECTNINDIMTQNAAILSKGDDAIDVLINPGFEQISKLITDPDLELFTYASGYTSLYPSSRNDDSPFAKFEVRQAVSFALDRELLCKARGFGIATPATQVIVKDYLGYFDDGRNYFPYDQAKAKELLAQAGYPSGFDTTIIAQSTADLDLVVAVQKMLGDVGIRCELQIVEAAIAAEINRVTGWEGLLFTNFTNVVSMPTTYSGFDDRYANNISVYRPVEKFMDILNASRKTEWFEDSLFQDLNRIFSEEHVVIPMITSNFSYVVRKSVRGGEFGFHGGGTIYLPQELWRATK